MNVSHPRNFIRRMSSKAAALLALHAVLFAFALFVAFFTRNDFSFAGGWLPTYLSVVGSVVVLKLMVFYALGLCHVSWHRVSFGDLTSLLWGATLAILIMTTIDGMLISTGRIAGLKRVPRSVILLDWACTIMLVGGMRAVWRSFYEELRPILRGTPVKMTLIIGANQAGELLARNLKAAPNSPYHVVGFLDEDPALHGNRFSGIAVLGSIDRASFAVKRHRVQEVLVQSGTLTGRQFRRLFDECTEAGADVKVIPAIDELLGERSDNQKHVRLRAVEIKDLLRREPVRLDDSAVARLVAGRTVMVTGAGGSIGSEICRQVLRFHPQRLLLVERGENSLFLIEQEFSRFHPKPPFEPLIADITDEDRIDQIMADYKPAVVFHAAAHKHVPMMEWNPAEAIKNNCLGTRTLARLADRHGVGTFVTISTDKAVHPTSVMGCSKLIAERYVQAFSKESSTKFIVVRFGNVLASNGSVVPIFQEQIRRGGPITVTHPDIERYFMMIPEASQLVLQAAAMGDGGEIFVLDMGESVKIVDLARDLIALSGLAEDDIDIKFTGLRPGEKLYEELYFDDERRLPTPHPKVFCAMHRAADLSEIEGILEELREVVDDPPDDVRRRLRKLVPEYDQEQQQPKVNADA